MLPAAAKAWLLAATMAAATAGWPAPGVRPGLAGETAASYLSPTALTAAKDGQRLFVACATANQVLVFDTGQGRVGWTVATPPRPTGLALAADETRLFVTCAAPESQVCVVNVPSRQVVAAIPAGHSATAPVLSRDGQTLFVCNRFDDEVSAIDWQAKQTLWRVKAAREPVAAALTRDGRFLLVANHLHNGRADAEHVAASVSVVDLAARKVIKELRLPNGSGLLNDLRVSPDGKYACVTHLLAHYSLPATQLERGWLNTNALTIIDLERLEVVNTVLLDSVDSGAANPWGLAWSGDGRTLLAAHAGTHEISVIDFPALLAKLAGLPVNLPASAPNQSYASARVQSDVPRDLAFMTGLRRRVKLPDSDRGPRAIALAGATAWVANYFSDTLSKFEMTPASPGPQVQSIPLGPPREMTAVRRGEFYFHDAGLCFQGWQSCASCHPGEARTDALNWDLLNDGLGNPKNTRSLLLAHQTAPAMSTGVRPTAEAAVRAGLTHVLFTVQPEAVAVAMDEYVKSLPPVPSPHLRRGGLSPAARRGERLFNAPATGCAVCHPPGLFTDRRPYEVGTPGPLDQPGQQFDTPALVELWRTGPYLHDGSAATVREVLTSRNPRDQHGRTAHLSAAQVDDLVEYLLSL